MREGGSGRARALVPPPIKTTHTHPRNLFDGGAAVRHLARPVPGQGRLHRVRSDGHLVRPRPEVLGRDGEGGVDGAVRVGRASDAPAHRQRHEHALRRPAQDFQHGQVTQRGLPEARDVEEGHLIRAFLVITARQVDGLAQVAHITAAPARRPIALLAGAGRLPHIVLVALGDDQVARIVGPDVQAGDDPAGEAPGAGRGRRGGGRRGGRARSARGLSRTATRPALQEAAQHVQPRPARLFRVELGGAHVPLAHGCNEVAAIVAGGGHPVHVGGRRLRPERVHEIDAPPVEAGQQGRGRGLADLQVVPADVGDGQGVGTLVAGEPADGARDEAQAGDAPVFFRPLKQELEAEADAQEGAPRPHVVSQGAVQPAFLEGAHGLLVGADAREDEAFSAGQVGGGLDLGWKTRDG